MPAAKKGRATVAKRPRQAKKPLKTGADRSARRVGRARGMAGRIPDRIFAQASPHSIGRVSMFEAQDQIHSGTVGGFFSEQDLVQRAVYRLQDAGFEVLQVSSTSINIAASADTYRRAFNATIVTDERPVLKELGRRDTATFLVAQESPLSGVESQDVV